MNTTKTTLVSGKLSKKDKYLPPKTLKKLYQNITSIRDLAYIQYHAETGLRGREGIGL